jgi:hypothetical protein
MAGLATPLRDPERHLEVIRGCAQEWNGRRIVLAAPPGSRYPYVYPRDAGGLARSLLRMVERDFHAREAFEHLEASAEFLLNVQRPDGYWGQRYDLTGEEKSIYRQEDNLAHGLIVLGSYLKAASTLGVEPPRLADVLDAMTRAYRYSHREIYRPGINLFLTPRNRDVPNMREGLEPYHASPADCSIHEGPELRASWGTDSVQDSTAGSGLAWALPSMGDNGVAV